MSANVICFARIGTDGARVDREKGVIFGVSVITVGPALGHDMDVDLTTLAQVKTCAETYGGGLKVKADHGSGVLQTVGRLTNFRMDGDQLRADLELLKADPTAREKILEMAETMPDAFGLSIAFSGPHEKSGKTTLARCMEIYSADIVDDPAANPNGLFERRRFDDPANGKEQPKEKAIMDDETKGAIGAIIDERLTEIKDRLAKLEEPPAGEEEKEMSAKHAEAVKLAAQQGAELALKEFAKTFGEPKAPGASGEPKKPEEPKAKTFEQLVAEKTAEMKDKAEAIRFCVKNHKAEHAAYQARVAAGEIITL